MQPLQSVKFPTFVRTFVDGAKKQLIKFFGGEMFRKRRRNMLVENGLKDYLALLKYYSWSGR